MKRTRVLGAMMAAAAMVGMLVPASAEAGFFRRRDGEPRAWVKAAKGTVKTVTHPFAARVRRNQRGGLVGSF